ncbi:MAG: hypothetical protein ACXW2E_00485 [Nitrososphaeraceae archaeon]
MKLVIVLSLFLFSCANIQFDSLEYDRYITIKEIVDSDSMCSSVVVDQQLLRVKQLVDHQVLYASNRTDRVKITEATNNLKVMVDKLYSRYEQSNKPSLVYCQEKLKNISIGASVIIQVLGRFE